MSYPVERKPIDRWLPWFFVLFFVVVFSVNGVMVYFAASSWTGIETKQSYIKGRDYNETLAKVERQKAQGWDGGLAVRTEEGHRVRLELTLTDPGKSSIAGAEVTARFVRPTHEGYDREFRLDDYGRGHYTGVLEMPLPGQWDVRVVARHPSGEFHLTRRIMVP